jgi:alkyldihydroxyacetonephosphate synthase
MRSGQVEGFPDGVAFPESEEEIRLWLTFAQKNNIQLIPYGGGTSVVGHITPLSKQGPVLTLDLSRMNQLLNLDADSQLATFGAGIAGPALESLLNRQGLTLGHFPQSFELSTLGGWIATRSSGQQSYYYGRIENLFAGGHIETPSGPLDLPSLPASAAGPDLRQVILGSEGRLGVITQATVRIRPLPQFEAFYGFFFRKWEKGVQAVRQLVQARLPISMARLSDPTETETTLILSGKENLVNWAKRGLGVLRYADQRCLLILGITGNKRQANQVLQQVKHITQRNGGLFTGETIGKLWRKSRFLTPYLRNTLWEKGYAIDTLETALPWSGIVPTTQAIKKAIHTGSQAHQKKAWVFSHLSHVYEDGASIYVTYIFPRSTDPQATLEHWRSMKSTASQTIVERKGTISHQHGVGLDHAPYLPAEKGELGIELIAACAKSLDPQGIMNPGKLFTPAQETQA